ncbi:guanine deaminase [bacterium]|nr:guanine deaminase [bacterium]
MSDRKQSTIAIKGSVFHFVENPFKTDEERSFQYYENGMLVIKEGKVHAVGAFAEESIRLEPGIQVIDHSGHLIMPGFIDTHLHYPQTDIIASYGKQLLEWLQTYTFPREGMFKDAEYAESVADFFFDELLRNGTTTAQVMATVHKHSAEIFFRKAQERNLRMISGKVMMDRNAPDYLLDSPETGFEESLELIETWHKKDRLLYAVSPRFAVTSTGEQLKKSAELLNSRPDLYFQTHLSENRAEVALIAELFPWSKDYLDVYDKFGLINERATFAHSIHLEDKNYQRLSELKAAVSFCPTSNLFIGSGLFDLEKITMARIKLGMGTDVGGGTSFSMLKTLGDAYKVLQLKGQKLSALQAFYLATLGGAGSLCLEDKIGNFLPGKEADFLVMDFNTTPLMQRRMAEASSLQEKLFIAMILGDDRNIKATYIMGEKVHGD